MPKQTYDRPQVLDDFEHFLAYSRAKKADPKLSRSKFAKSAGLRGEQSKKAIERLEKLLGVFLVERVVKDKFEHEELPYRPKNPEELAWIRGVHERRKPNEADQDDEAEKETVGRQCPTEMKSELTLDGQIWAEFGNIVFDLLALTRSATHSIKLSDAENLTREELLNRRKEWMRARLKVPLDPDELAQDTIPASKVRTYRPYLNWPGVVPSHEKADRAPETPERDIPTRHAVYNREGFLFWLSQHKETFAEARNIADQESVFELAKAYFGD